MRQPLCSVPCEMRVPPENGLGAAARDSCVKGQQGRAVAVTVTGFKVKLEDCN